MLITPELPLAPTIPLMLHMLAHGYRNTSVIIKEVQRFVRAKARLYSAAE